MEAVTSEEHRAVARLVREDLAVWKEGRDLVEIGAYRSGTNPRLDQALERIDRVQAFLRQGAGERADFEDTLRALAGVFGGGAE